MLEETLREIVESRSKYEDAVNRVIAWRSGPGSRKTVAENWMRLLDGQIQPDWLFSPASVTHLFFGFAPRDVIRDYVRGFVAKQGVGALGLQHRPNLQDLVVSFADL
jgi:hypothetical protein